MLDDHRLMYIHGSENASNSGKARTFRQWFPGMVTPDLKGSFEARMSQLLDVTADKTNWMLIGSSYGGLMATVFALDHEAQLQKLTLDPRLSFSEPKQISVPTVLIHGTLDSVVPLEPVREIARKLFANLTTHKVEDDHRLHKIANEMD